MVIITIPMTFITADNYCDDILLELYSAYNVDRAPTK